VLEEAVKKREQAFEEEQRRRADQARRSDQLGGQDPATRQLRREREARTAAVLGYRLRENTSVAGQGVHAVLMDGVADCALACTKEGCDAFKYNRGGPPTSGKRYCYLYRAPYTQLPDTADYVFGERDPRSTLLDSALAEEAVRRAAAEPLPTVVDDGLTRCAGGPVKVTNFKLTCDQNLVGGARIVGENRLSVANINQCAARCTMAANCAAFAFNAAEPDGTHLCQLLAPGYQPRSVSGWISGVK
jgi:hypothetical protein